MSGPQLVVSGNRHFYQYDGDLGPSVTGILRVGFPKPALVGWAAKATAKSAVLDRKKWWGIAETSEDTAIDMLKRVRFEQRDAAAQLGARIHDIVATGAEPDPEAKPFVESYEQWLDRFHAEVVEHEMVVWHSEHRYGGTADLVLDIQGERMLYDIKTGRTANYPDQQLQLVAYERADVGVLAGLGVTGRAVLHVRPEKVTAYRFTNEQADWEAFLAVKRLAEFIDPNLNKMEGAHDE